MNEQEQARFDGWAIVDVLGHQRYVGYVKTEAFGQAVMFRVDVPSLEARKHTLTEPGYLDGKLCGVGTEVERAGSPGYTKLIGSGSIYTISPCDEAAALKALEATLHRPLKLITLVEADRVLLANEPSDAADPDEEDEDIAY